MQKLIEFLNAFPARFPLMCLFAMGASLFIWMMGLSASSPTTDSTYGAAGWNILFYIYYGFIAVVIVGVIAIVLFMIEALAGPTFYINKRQPGWLLFWPATTGLLLPFWMIGSSLWAPQLEDAKYMFASPEVKLSRAMDRERMADVKRLLAQGADVNTQDSHLRTPLQIALLKNDYELANRLIADGANFSTKDAHGKTTLCYILSPQNDEHITRSLKSRAERANLALKLLDKNGSAKDAEHCSVLAGAVETGSLTLVQQLLAKGLKPDSNPYPEGYRYSPDCFTSPLYQAAYLGEVDIIQLLLEYGANVDGHIPENYCFPILAAVMRGKSEAAELLLQEGAETRVRESEEGNILLISAAKSDISDGFFRLLIAQKPDVNAVAMVGAWKTTALSMAARQGELAKFKILLNAGAVFQPNNEEASELLDKAVQSHHLPMVQYLLARGVAADLSHLATAIEENQTEIAELLLERGLELNNGLKYHLKQGRGSYAEPIFVAVQNNNLLMVKLLLAYGADANAVGPAFQGMVQAACEANLSEDTLPIIQVLLDAGSDLKHRDAQGKTAYMVIADRAARTGGTAAKIEAYLRESYPREKKI